MTTKTPAASSPSAGAPAAKAPASGQAWAVLAEFDSAHAIYHAAKQVTDAGYTRVDSHTPFPIHGLDQALRQGPSHLGWFVVCGGILGIASAQLMMWWMNAYDYEMWVSGKQPYAWPSTIPITFELMVLLSALTAVFGMFVLNKLPRLHHPIFEYSRFDKITDDKFVLSIEAIDPKFDRTGTVQFLEKIGGKHVEVVQE